MRAFSLRRRLLLSMCVIIVVCVAGMTLYLHGTRDVVRRGLVFIQAQEVAADFIASGDTARLPAFYAGGEMSYTLYSAERDVLWVSSDRSRPLRLREDSLEALAQRFWYRNDIGYVINVPVRLDDGRILMVARRDRNERAAIESLLDARLRHSLVLLAPLLLLFGALIWALLAWTLAPVRRAARLAEKIGPEHAEPIPEDTLPGEIRPLVRALNQAVGRLGHALEAERQILADGAHELRTPVTVVDLRLQKFEQDGRVDWPVLRKDLQHLRRVTEQLLLLSRQDHAAHSSSHQSCRLAAVVREVLADLYPLFERSGRTLVLEASGCEPAVCGQQGLLREVVINALENALAHGAGTVTVRLGPAPDGQSVWLEVEDEGAGVPLARQHEYFVRFRKGRSDSAGAGLGLAIVRRIVGNLGGDVRFVSSTPCVLRMALRPADPREA